MSPEQLYDKIRAHYGLERNIDFAKRLGVSPQNANALMKRVYIDYDLIHKKFPEISAEWLLSKGEKGEMIGDGGAVNGGTVNSSFINVAGHAVHEDLVKALLNEQETCKKLQDQMAGLLEVLKNLSAKGRQDPS